MAKTYNEMIVEATELKEKRSLMGMSAIEVCKLTNTNQGNYSKMEQGLLNCEKPLKEIRLLYNEWVVKEANRLEKQSEYLKSLTN